MDQIRTPRTGPRAGRERKPTLDCAGGYAWSQAEYPRNEQAAGTELESLFSFVCGEPRRLRTRAQGDRLASTEASRTKQEAGTGKEAGRSTRLSDRSREKNAGEREAALYGATRWSRPKGSALHILCVSTARRCGMRLWNVIKPSGTPTWRGRSTAGEAACCDARRDAARAQRASYTLITSRGTQAVLTWTAISIGPPSCDLEPCSECRAQDLMGEGKKGDTCGDSAIGGNARTDSRGQLRQTQCNAKKLAPTPSR